MSIELFQITHARKSVIGPVQIDDFDTLPSQTPLPICARSGTSAKLIGRKIATALNYQYRPRELIQPETHGLDESFGPCDRLSPRPIPENRNHHSPASSRRLAAAVDARSIA
jgi:hypothetical protein